MTGKRSPLVIFALDSANYDLVEKWAGEGFLPNMAALMREGTTWEVGGPGVYDEIGAWITAFSGVSQSEHGFYASRRLKHGRYELKLAHFDTADVLPFWAFPDSNGLKSAILDLPEPYIVPNVYGIQVTNLNMHYEQYAYQSPASEPPELIERITREMGPDDVPAFNQFTKPVKYYLDHLQKNLARLKRRGNTFRQILSEENYELIVLGFGETHDIAHLVWQFEQDVHTDTKPETALSHGLRTIYQEVDKELGLFMDQMPADSQLMVLSTYGIKSQYPTARLGEFLLDRLGYRVPAKNKVRLLDPISIARKILPETIRYRLSHFLGFEYQQKLLCENFAQGTDWSRTRAFTIPSLYQNWIRINLKGREPQGIVNVEDYIALLNEIEQQMRLIKDPATGQSAIGNVFRPIDPALQDPLHNKGPDLVVYWKASDHLLELVNHPSGDLKQSRPGFNRDSFHNLPGIAILKGPGIDAGVKKNCGILDIAPTCMDLLNLSGSEELAGQSQLGGLQGTAK